MKKKIFWLTVVCISIVLTTASYGQSASVKQSPNQPAATTPAWPECCWVGKTTASKNAAPEQQTESATEKNASTESTSGASSAGADSGASLTSSGSEGSSESSSAEQGSNGLKQKLTDTALEFLKDKLMNKQSESSDTSSSTQTSSDFIGETEKNLTTTSTETTTPIDSVQEVKQTDPNKRRQRMQALRERLQNSKSNAAATSADANASTETVQEVPGGRRRAQRGQQNSDTATTVVPNETGNNRVRPRRNQPTEQNATPNAPERPLHNNNGGMINGNRMGQMRTAREARQNAPKPKPGNVRRKP